MPGREIVYFDTSALAKWYLNEELSDEVERYIQEHGPVAISDLTAVEMRSLLSRRRREREIDIKTETRAFAVFEEDVRRGFLIRNPLPATLAAGAVNLIASFPDLPLRALDAMHLVAAQEIGAGVLATSDRVMAEAAEALGLAVVRFLERRS
ncbi:MAG TPA: type II toxin-antitoxin system VapC family toxin [Candidatus Deferrimicrobiaceae bacterium]|nr:type II toxin-antitoxin system VapC family toxin [Candidatus Deferrimicrobiaceae bacterium]